MTQIAHLLEIMAQLRDKEHGCPWDIEQDFHSIAPHTIEEAYEVADAIAENDMEGLKDELGDLLLQVVFHSQMASEAQLFTFEEVAQTISEKLVRRHPHVFGDTDIKDAQGVEQNWEAIKAQEKAAKGAAQESLMDGVTKGLPGLLRAVKLQKRAARVGFDWENSEAIFAKLEEEVEELKEAIASGNKADMQSELGDVLFVITNIARHLKIDPEQAIRDTNRKFETRFRHMENQEQDLAALDIDALEELWQRAKQATRATSRDEALTGA